VPAKASAIVLTPPLPKAMRTLGNDVRLLPA
jgi:hypothetical protein